MSVALRHRGTDQCPGRVFRGKSLLGYSIAYLTLFLSLSALGATVALAVQPTGPLTRKGALEALESFRERIRSIQADLDEDRPKRAYKSADHLLLEMTERFISGPSVKVYLGLATARDHQDRRGA